MFYAIRIEALTLIYLLAKKGYKTYLCEMYNLYNI